MVASLAMVSAGAVMEEENGDLDWTSTVRLSFMVNSGMADLCDG